MNITFTDESILAIDSEGKGVVGRPILSSVGMIVQHPVKRVYTGPLPYGIAIHTSQAAMRSRFGQPVETDDDLRWDSWLVEGLVLYASYLDDLQSIDRIAVRLPGSR
jgi:hypothetical protein